MQNSMVTFTFSVFDRANAFWANLVQKIKLVSSMWNSRVKLIQICRIQCWCSLFLFLSGNTHFGQNQNYQSELKIGTYTNSSMLNSMIIFTFSVFDRKYPFWANLVQKVKIISLSWNLVPRLIRICKIQWWCSLFLFLTGNTLFGTIWSKKSKLLG